MHIEPISLSNASVASSFAGEAPFDLVLIAVQPGHPPEAEATLLAVLREIHAQLPLDWLFAALDPQHVEINLEQSELAVTPYRSYPDKEITEGIIDYFIRSGQCSAEFAFGVVSEPPVRVLPRDDWHGWALAREAVRTMDARAAKLALALHLLADAWDADAPALVEQFTKLLRLQLTYPEYVQLCERDEDFRHFLAGGLGERLPAAVARFLATARVTAQDFYRGMRLRVEALIEGAAEKMHRERARRGALTLAVHFAELGEELLRQRGVSFVKVTPHDVAITSLLEGAGEFLGEEHRERKLEQLFAGEPIRTEVEMLLSQDDGESREACAKDWATAAQAYGAQYELKRDRAAREKAAECLDHAFALAPDLAQSLWLKGTLLRLEHDAKGALEWFERALSKDARNGNCWAAKGDSLQALNRTRAAHNCYVRALQLSPGAGELWTALGLFFYNTGRRRAACYCFFKGKELGSESASQNFRMVCHHQPSFWDCPFRLWPSISKLMRNFILPLRYGWDDIRSITGTVAGLIGTLSAAAYGAFLGFHTAGFVGSIAGFFTLLLAALILVAGIFLNAAELSARPHWGRSAIARILLSLICAVAGRYLAIQISGSRWQPLLSLALMLALAGISGFIYLIVSAEPDSVRAKS